MTKRTITYVLLTVITLLLGGIKNTNAQTCAAPLGLVTTGTQAINTTLSWSPESGAYYYKIKINPVASPNNVVNYTAASNSILLGALIPTMTYECRIATVCASGTSPYSNPYLFSTTTSATCGTPQNIVSSAITSANVTIKWGTVVGAGAYTIKILENGLPVKTLTATKPPLVVTGLKSATTYTYTVCSVCSGIPGAASASNTFTTLAATSCGTPSGVIVSKITNSGAKIAWNTVPGANLYKLTITAIAFPIPITYTNITTNSYDLQNLTPNAAYTYKVAAVCSGVEGTASALGSFTTNAAICAQPFGINTSNITATSININFIKGATGNNAITRLFLQKNGENFAKTFSSATNTIAVTNLEPNTTYNYQLASVCNGDQNDPTSNFSFTTLPAPTCFPPSNIGISDTTDSQAKVSWSPIAGVTSYTITVIANDSIMTKYISTQPTFTASGLAAATNHKITVSANCIANIAGTASIPMPFTTLAIQNCNAPSSLNVFNINVSKAKFTWNSIVGVAKYRILIRKQGSNTPIYLESTTSELNVTNLEPNKVYSACVASVCNSKISAFCPVTTFTTLLDGNCPPPTGINATNLTQTSAKIKWDSLPGTTSWTLLIYPTGMPNMNYITVNTAYYMAKNLQVGKTYDVVVMANCPYSTLSASSTTFTFTTVGYTSCTDSYEPNNTLATAMNMTENVAINAGIHTLSDKDYFKITTTQAKPYLRVSLTNLPADFDLKLLTASGTLLSSSEKLGTKSEVITFNNPLPANFNILVYGFGNTFVAGKCYQLLVETSATPFGAVGVTQLVQATNNNKVAPSMPHSKPIEISKTSSNFDLKIYPNPTNSEVTINFDDEFRGNISLSLSDLQGRNLEKKSLQVENTGTIFQIDLNDYPDGLYLLTAQSDQILKTYKIVLKK